MSPNNTTSVSSSSHGGHKTATMATIDTILSRNAMIWRRESRKRC